MSDTATITKQQLLDRVRTGRHVVVLRGVSGSGKTTLSLELAAAASTVECVSADAFFTDADGRYSFDGAKLGEAHAECLRHFVRALQTDNAYGVRDSLVLVDNTNTSIAECAPYMALAAAYGFKALIVTLDVPGRIAHARNLHGVSAEGVEAQGWRMAADEARFPPFWERVRLVEGEALDPAEQSNRGQR
jgi:predicted kinase